MNVQNICRICLSNDSLIAIFKNKNYPDLATKIMSIGKVEIYLNDGLPATICMDCLKKLNGCIEFIQLCKTSDTKLRITLESATLTNDNDFNECKISPKSDVEGDILIDINIESSISCEGSNDKVKQEIINKNDLHTDKNRNNKHRKAVKQQCSICGKVMSSGFRLKTHLRIHSGERPYSCPHCPKTFTLEQNLKVHLRIHTGEKPLSCSICSKSFAQSAGLAAHRRKHTGQTPYNCKLCPKSFRTFGHLQYHVRHHTGEKKFECDSCGHAFITRSHMKYHLMTHTGDRPHVCCECGARFTRSTHLKRHMQRLHNETHKNLKQRETEGTTRNEKNIDTKETTLVNTAAEI